MDVSANNTFRSKVKLAIVSVPVVLGVAANAGASEITAENVMTLPPADRYLFITGIVEGLAIARYNKDGKQKQGMKCIYDWFYESKQIAITIEAAFSKYPKYPPGSIVDVLAKQKCGE